MSIVVKQMANLVKGCIANERSAQEGLYKLYYSDMLRLCYRYLPTNALAEEALNMGFLKVFQNIGSYTVEKGELGAWVRTIMVRTCIDLLRSEAKFINSADLTDEADDVFISPDVLNKLYAEDIMKSIRLLPCATQMVFNLAVIDGYSHKEIGEQLSISESTSRWHLSEAKKQLRMLLQQPGHHINPSTENIKKRK